MAIKVYGYTRYGPLPVPPGPTTTSTTTTSTTAAPTTTSTTTSTTTAAPTTTSTTTTTTTGAGTTSTTTTTTTAAPNNVNITIYNDACTITGTIIVFPGDGASVGLYYRIAPDVIYYVNSFTSDPYDQVQTMGTGYALCPPPA